MNKTRPCDCDNCAIGGSYEKGHCRLCWLYHNDNRYRKLWTEVEPTEPTKPNKLPSKITQAINIVVAIRKRIESYYKNVSDESYIMRLATCSLCPNKTDDWRCTKCGCYLNIKAKWESEKCPENRWQLSVIKEAKGCGCGNK